MLPRRAHSAAQHSAALPPATPGASGLPPLAHPPEKLTSQGAPRCAAAMASAACPLCRASNLPSATTGGCAAAGPAAQPVSGRRQPSTVQRGSAAGSKGASGALWVQAGGCGGRFRLAPPRTTPGHQAHGRLCRRVGSSRPSAHLRRPLHEWVSACGPWGLPSPEPRPVAAGGRSQGRAA